jgi:hypothetical protein
MTTNLKGVPLHFVSNYLNNDFYREANVSFAKHDDPIPTHRDQRCGGICYRTQKQHSSDFIWKIIQILAFSPVPHPPPAPISFFLSVLEF